VIVRACWIAVEADFDDDAISGYCSVVACGTGDCGASRCQCRRCLLSAILTFRDEGLLQSRAIEDVDSPSKEEIVIRRSLSLTHHDGDVLPACDRLTCVKRVRDELREDDVLLS